MTECDLYAKCVEWRGYAEYLQRYIDGMWAAIIILAVLAGGALGTLIFLYWRRHVHVPQGIVLPSPLCGHEIKIAELDAECVRLRGLLDVHGRDLAGAEHRMSVLVAEVNRPRVQPGPPIILFGLESDLEEGIAVEHDNVLSIRAYT